MKLFSLATVVALVLLASCTLPRAKTQPRRSHEVETELAVARSPFDQVEASWKQRLDQPYVFIELVGSYTRLGKTLEQVDASMRAQGIPAAGPPFALYYDDPARKPAAELRARACFPVTSRIAPDAPLRFDVLPDTTVVYAYVGGAYPEVPRAYPALFAYLARMRWRDAGPIREVYMINPAAVTSFDELICEVQIPASAL